MHSFCMMYIQKWCIIVSQTTAMFRELTAALLVQFHEHASGLHVFGRTERLPSNHAIPVDVTCAALSEPPSAPTSAVAVRTHVIVAVLRSEHSAIGDPVRPLWSHHSIAGVSAVPGHRQLVLTSLITDGERRVFSPVPLTVSTMDLHKTTTHHRHSFVHTL